MKTITKTVAELIVTGESPLDLAVIPNYMGINLCEHPIETKEEK